MKTINGQDLFKYCPGEGDKWTGSCPGEGDKCTGYCQGEGDKWTGSCPGEGDKVIVKYFPCIDRFLAPCVIELLMFYC